MADEDDLPPADVSAIKILVAAYQATRSPFDHLEEHHRAFVEATKAFTMIAGAGATGLNMFGVSIAYMSKRAIHANDSSQSSPAAPACAPASSPTSNGFGALNPVKNWMLIITFFCFLYTCCCAAVAHATVHRVQWLKTLAVMVYFELFLIASICGLYYYMLTEDAEVAMSIFFPAIGFSLTAYAVHLLFDPHGPPRQVNYQIPVPNPAQALQVQIE